MGAALGLPNPAAMAEQQAAMQRRMMQRQLAMQLEMRERMMAAQVAGARDLVQWLVGTLAVVAPALVLGAARTGNRALLVPLVPLSIITSYNYDFAYGSKPERIVAEAERILREERALFALPGEPLSVDLLDRNIAAASEVGAKQQPQQQQQQQQQRQKLRAALA
jgi:hypothetical protein